MSRGVVMVPVGTAVVLGAAEADAETVALASAPALEVVVGAALAVVLAAALAEADGLAEAEAFALSAVGVPSPQAASASGITSAAATTPALTPVGASAVRVVPQNGQLDSVFRTWRSQLAQWVSRLMNRTVAGSTQE